MRMTRAALRAQESEEALRDQLALQLKNQGVVHSFDDVLIHEDSDKENSMVNESEAKSLESEQSDRKVLKDITDETYPNAEMANTQEANQVVTKKGKKGKGKGSKDKVQMTDVEMQHSAVASPSTIELDQSADDPNIVTGFSASVGTPPKPKNDAEDPASLINKTPVSVTRASTGVSNGTPGQVRHSLSTMPQSPYDVSTSGSKPLLFSPSNHVQFEESMHTGRDESQDSFLENIKSRSPSKHQTPVKEVDSFIKDITSRTPSRSIPSPRVEDSVAALDALEDAMEKIAEDLPPLDPVSASSPTKTRPATAKSPLKVTVKASSRGPQKPLSPTKPKMSTTNSNGSAARLSVKDRIKAFETKPPAQSHRRANSVAAVKTHFTPVTKAPTKPAHAPRHAPSKSVTVVASKPMVSPPGSPAKPQQNMVKKRVPSGPLSTSRPGFVPTKSTKPLTKSAFVLPGDAIAAKLKAQREERAKKEEEEAASKKKQFKARPAPAKTAGPSVIPRENKASQARMRRISGEDKENVEPVKSTVPKTTISTAKTRLNTTVQPNSSVRRTSPSASSNNSSVRPTQTTLRVTSNESTTSQVSQTSTIKAVPKSKDAFNRQRLTIIDAQRVKKEKEEAAKKARAEAAERGRLASREWAEKQKQRLMTEKEAKAKASEQAVVV